LRGVAWTVTALLREIAMRFPKSLTMFVFLAGIALAVPAVGASASARPAHIAGRYIPETCAHSANCVAQVYRPRTFQLQRAYFTIDDFGAKVTDIQWTHYSRTSARGVGIAYLSQGGGGTHQCSPEILRACADRLGRVVILFYRPEGSRPGDYTRLHMTGQRRINGYGLAHWWHFDFHKTIGGSPAWLPAGENS